MITKEELEFWEKVYLLHAEKGSDHDNCKTLADKALQARREAMK